MVGDFGDVCCYVEFGGWEEYCEEVFYDYVVQFLFWFGQ